MGSRGASLKTESQSIGTNTPSGFNAKEMSVIDDLVKNYNDMTTSDIQAVVEASIALKRQDAVINEIERRAQEAQKPAEEPKGRNAKPKKETVDDKYNSLREGIMAMTRNSVTGAVVDINKGRETRFDNMSNRTKDPYFNIDTREFTPTEMRQIGNYLERNGYKSETNGAYRIAIHLNKAGSNNTSAGNIIGKTFSSRFIGDSKLSGEYRLDKKTATTATFYDMGTKRTITRKVIDSGDEVKFRMGSGEFLSISKKDWNK